MFIKSVFSRLLPKWFSDKSQRAPASMNDNYTSLEKVYTPVNALTIGMYVVELDKPWLESSFVFQGFELKTEQEIEAVKHECSFVYIDQTRQTRKKENHVEQKKTSKAHLGDDLFIPERRGSVEQEIERADEIVTDTRHLVADFMEKIAEGGGVDSTLAKQAVAECVNSVLHSPDAMIWLSQLKNKHEYTAQHSMNVCVLSIVLGRQINLSEEELNRVGLCGMMHDMGKMLIPPEIIDKPSALDDEEFRIMKTHTTLGYELLRSSHGMFPGAIETAYNHHERLDRQGYPRKINRDMISQYTRIVAIADMYDAITSDRVYQKGRTHLEATNIMSNLADKHLEGKLVEKFIESLGIYPPGSFVMMNNGDIAIIVEVNPETKLRPKIIVILNREKVRIPEKVIDLSITPRDTRGNVYVIKGIVHALDYGIDAREYYHKGVIQKGFSAVK